MPPGQAAGHRPHRLSAEPTLAGVAAGVRSRAGSSWQVCSPRGARKQGLAKDAGEGAGLEAQVVRGSRGRHPVGEAGVAPWGRLSLGGGAGAGVEPAKESGYLWPLLFQWELSS